MIQVAKRRPSGGQGEVAVMYCDKETQKMVHLTCGRFGHTDFFDL